MDPILRLENVGFRYAAEWVLERVGLAVGPGEVWGVLGPNGCGKSTLLGIMAGRLRPQTGAVRLKERAVSAYRGQELAREVAVLSQENSFAFPFTALEVVLMGRFAHLEGRLFEGRGDMALAREGLRYVDALHLAARPITTLSGGEKQRVLMARALAQQARLLLLDEPTAFLDLKYKREVFRLLAAMARERGLTVVVVTHDLDLAARHCDTLVLLKGGRIAASGAPAEVLRADTVAAVYNCPVIVDAHPADGSPRVNVV